MQEIEFVNDLRCNYLTIPYAGEEKDFALRMLTENIAEGFLKMELRRMDGQTYLYYNISGMQSMEIIYMEKPKRLFFALNAAKSRKSVSSVQQPGSCLNWLTGSKKAAA